MESIHELANLETSEYCILNVKTGNITLSSHKSNNKFTGLYFIDKRIFFAIYPTELGPEIYYNGNVYQIHKQLNIFFKERGSNREFCIPEYNIVIKYLKSSYIDMDIWSGEEDIDLFFMIKQRYRSSDFYKQYTINNQ